MISSAKHDGTDMIVSLFNLPTYKESDSAIKIKRAFIGDKDTILQFVERYFQENWKYEVEHALMQDVSKCFIVTENKKILGFACYDSYAKGFFGPIGVDPNYRKRGVGSALLVRTLNAMQEYGYGYAIIGWVSSDVQAFYRKAIDAQPIRGNSEEGVFSNLIFLG